MTAKLNTHRGLMGTTHRCGACGYEVLLGPGHHSDLAVCTSCGADLVVEYPGGMFACCTQETPGTLIWFNSDQLKVDEGDKPMEIRRDVLPLPNCSLPDLRNDTCPKCKAVAALVTRLPNKCACPKCHQGRLRKVGSWIQ